REQFGGRGEEQFWCVHVFTCLSKVMGRAGWRAWRSGRWGGGVNPFEPPRGRRISPRAPASTLLGEIRRRRTGAAQVSLGEPKRRTGERDQRRGLTPTGPHRPH